MSERGVYILANDVTAEWLEACLRSLRRFEPALPVCILPFDERMGRVSEIAARFGAGVWEDPGLLELDRLGSGLADSYVTIRSFRKLAAFWGPFETFLYLDADIVALGPHLTRWLEVFHASDADFVYVDSDMDEAFQPGPLRDSMRESGSPGFNSGVFLARRSALSRERIEAALVAAREVVGGFSRHAEQAFFNWIVVVERLRLRYLLELLPEYATTSWYRQEIRRRGETWVQRWQGADRPFGVVHWAGVSIPFFGQHRLFLHFRCLGEPWSVRWGYALRWYLGCARKRLRDRRGR